MTASASTNDFLFLGIGLHGMTSLTPCPGPEVIAETRSRDNSEQVKSRSKRTDAFKALAHVRSNKIKRTGPKPTGSGRRRLRLGLLQGSPSFEDKNEDF